MDTKFRQAETIDHQNEECQHIENSSSSSIRPRPVLPEELTREKPVLEKAYIGVLKEQRAASRAIAGLAGCVDLTCPRHLKRCHGKRVYLSALERTSLEEIRQLLAGRELDALFEDDLEVLEVPVEPARTKAQNVAASVFWSLHFHPDPRIEALVSGAALCAEDDDPRLLEHLESVARLVAGAAARFAIGNTCCNGAAAILEPRKGETPLMLALAAASVDRHPLWHAAMLAVDLVAHRQSGGAWPLLLNDDEEDETDGASKRPRLSDDRKTEAAPLVFPPELTLPKVYSLSKPQKQRDGSYLCTGYWAVLLQEPCALCAMALLHSRVARIFYGIVNPRSGVLGSKAVLHSVPGLNHRYEVWSGLLEAECTRAFAECRVVDDDD